MQRNSGSASIAYAGTGFVTESSPTQDAVAGDTVGFLANPSPDNASMAFLIAAERVNAQTKLIGQELRMAATENPKVKMPACKGGCAYCCHSQVSVLPIEALHLAASICDRMPADKSAETKQRVAGYLDEVRGLSFGERSLKVIACPLLSEAGECGSYANRPLVCRMHHSVDADRCKANLYDQSVSVPSIPIFADRILPVLAGLHQGCVEAGLVSRNLPLVDAVAVFLQQGAAQAWLGGDDIFDHIEYEGPE